MGRSVRSSNRGHNRDIAMDLTFSGRPATRNNPINTQDFAVPSMVNNLQMSLDVNRIRLKTSEYNTRS